MEDTALPSRTVTDGIVQVEKPKKSFALLFQDNRNPCKGMSLYKVEDQDNVVEVETDEGFGQDMLRNRRPLCTDVMTARMQRISYARVLVEVDIAKELIMEAKEGNKIENNPAVPKQRQGNKEAIDSGSELVPDSGCNQEQNGEQENLDKRKDNCERADSIITNLRPNQSQLNKNDSGQGQEMEETIQAGGKSPAGKDSEEVQKEDKGVIKRSTPIPVDKGPSKILSKDKGKMAMGKNEPAVLERRKGSSVHISSK
ncbi:hypothetical protein M9H77_36331 [Catharanthus roseus]|uniref:Uncharacterized protein n=1 Tax=Catharanthus roseus TaxID=4058 RepID=A0ACB9ZST3_CATRO|nr:hypothetical protein M9H77_36331 [Catharanthus roseus]